MADVRVVQINMDICLARLCAIYSDVLLRKIARDVGTVRFQKKVVEKFNTVGNVQPIFSDEFKEGERKQMYSLFLKEMTNTGIKYKLIEENKDLTTISEKVKRLVISGTPIEDLRIVKNVEFEFKCALKFKEDE